MKKYISILTLFTIAAVVLLTGCYTDTVDSLSTYKFQLPIDFKQKYLNKVAPDTSYDFTNLNKYKDYRDNKDRIVRAEITLANYWIDSLNVNGTVYLPRDPSNKYYFDYNTNTGTYTIQFNFIKFYLVFAKPGPYQYSTDPLDERNWVTDPLSQWHLLGQFNDVNVAHYYKMPQNILQIDQNTMEVLSEAIKSRPEFYIVSVYSNTVSGDRYFPFVRAGHYIIIRFEVEL